MKKIKFKQLATFSLCCSLLVNSLTGVTAVAETMTIESSPTTESTKESTKESAEESTEKSTQESIQPQEKEKTPEPSNNEIKEEKQKEATEVQEQKQAENLDKQVITEPMNPYSSVFRVDDQRALSTIDFPARSFQIYFVDEEGGIIDPSMVTMSAQSQGYRVTSPNGTVIIGPKESKDLTFTNVSNSKRFSIPGITTQYSSTPGTSEYSRYFYGVNNIKITIPKRYEKIDYLPSSYYKGSSYPIPVNRNRNMLTGAIIGVLTNDYFKLVPDTQPYTYKEYKVSGNGSGHSGGYYAGDTYQAYLFGITAPIYYYLTNRRVTENFVDATGAKLPSAPTGFAQGKKTSITSNDYTFTQSGTLPKSYKGTNGKTYVLKGWYKGKTKPSTLRTDAPSYKVTYDGNDDLNVVYEEAVEKTATIPAVTYKFGFVNEKGEYVAPTNFAMTTNLTEVRNATATKVGTATGTNVGNLKQLIMPGRQLTYTPDINPSFYGATDFRVVVPKYYQIPTVTPGTHYGGSTTAYPIATTKIKHISSPTEERVQTDGQIYSLYATNAANSYAMHGISWASDSTKTNFSGVLTSFTTQATPGYFTTDDTMYYFLENRRVTENFVDSNGTKITPPTGFTQGKQTVIDSDNFTYTQKGTLPYIYKVNNKPYVLKGWYKGKAKPAKLNQISTDNRNISYPVSYDDQDDVTVVYDELKLGGNTIQFGFVDEQGKYIPPTSKFNVSTDVGVVKDATYAKLQTVNSTIKGNYLSLTIPVYDPTGGISQGDIYYGSQNSIVTIPKYYKTPTVTPSSNYQGTAYPTVTGVVDYHGNGPTNEYLPSRLNLTSVSGSQTNYQLSQTIWANEETKTIFSSLYKMNYKSASDTAVSLGEIYATGTVNYYLENRRVTENFVDASGAKLPSAPTGFTQGNQIPMTSDTFKYTATKALPASYTAGGKTYVFQGWYKGKTKPNTLTTSTTPTFNTTFDDNDDMTAVYKEASISANLTMRGAVDIIDNGATMEYWEVLLKNTGEAPLTSIKIKPTAEWAAGISTPTELFLLGTDQNTKVLPITKEQWEAGFEIPLDSSLPVGGQLTINLIGTKVTGQPNQVLKAAVEVTGNFGNLKASDTVRIKDLDQETKEPTGEGFISVPTFDFGQVGVAGATKQHGLKKAADYYGNGTRNPYLRLKKTQPNWSLTAQLSQLKSAKDSLPTATRLIFGQVPVASVANYNQPTELVTSVGVTKALALTANNSSTSIIGTQEFGGADIYQLDFQFDKVKLEVPANQGTKGEQYNATVTWNLVTGP